jgi:hypothetical protein
VRSSTRRRRRSLTRFGAVDFALVSGRCESRLRDVRGVAPPTSRRCISWWELAESVATSLTALRGRTVDLGGPGTTTAGLATAVLAFAEVRPGDGTTADGYVARNLKARELVALLDRGDRNALPDALFHLATVPSMIALRLVRSADYRLVPAFAEAFRLPRSSPRTHASCRDRASAHAGYRHLAFSYQIEPPAPGEDLHTVERLLLVAHERFPRTVGGARAARPRFARMYRELLDRLMFALTPRMHPGTTF